MPLVVRLERERVGHEVRMDCILWWLQLMLRALAAPVASPSAAANKAAIPRAIAQSVLCSNAARSDRVLNLHLCGIIMDWLAPLVRRGLRRWKQPPERLQRPRHSRT